jgi:hypothetical protein
MPESLRPLSEYLHKQRKSIELNTFDPSANSIPESLQLTPKNLYNQRKLSQRRNALNSFARPQRHGGQPRPSLDRAKFLSMDRKALAHSLSGMTLREEVIKSDRSKNDGIPATSLSISEGLEASLDDFMSETTLALHKIATETEALREELRKHLINISDVKVVHRDLEKTCAELRWLRRVVRAQVERAQVERAQVQHHRSQALELERPGRSDHPQSINDTSTRQWESEEENAVTKPEFTNHVAEGGSTAAELEKRKREDTFRRLWEQLDLREHVGVTAEGVSDAGPVRSISRSSLHIGANSNEDAQFTTEQDLPRIGEKQSPAQPVILPARSKPERNGNWNPFHALESPATPSPSAASIAASEANNQPVVRGSSAMSLHEDQRNQIECAHTEPDEETDSTSGENIEALTPSKNAASSSLTTERNQSSSPEPTNEHTPMASECATSTNAHGDAEESEQCLDDNDLPGTSDARSEISSAPPNTDSDWDDVSVHSEPTASDSEIKSTENTHPGDGIRHCTGSQDNHRPAPTSSRAKGKQYRSAVNIPFISQGPVGRRRTHHREDEDSEEDQGPPRKAAKGTPASNKETLFACPYYKLDPRKHRSCHKFELKGITRVKYAYPGCPHAPREHTKFPTH